MEDKKKIIQIISDHLGISPDDLKPDADLREDLNAQDLEITDLIMHLEKEFAVNFTTEETKNLHTVNDIIELVRIG
jgi:acyl carrier protein